MAEDRLTDLRRALAGADGAGAVAAVEAAGLETSLQMAGDVLLLALADGAAGAKELATRCAVALRERGWSGDDELANELGAASGSGEREELVAIAVDLEQLADLVDGGMESPGAASTS